MFHQANNPDARPARVANCYYRFEELEIYPGVVAFDGKAEIVIDRFGDWQVESFILQGFGRLPDREYTMSDTHQDEAAIFRLVRRALEDDRSDQILDACMAAGEAE